jgi:hypothetical protein
MQAMMQYQNCVVNNAINHFPPKCTNSKRVILLDRITAKKVSNTHVTTDHAKSVDWGTHQQATMTTAAHFLPMMRPFAALDSFWQSPKLGPGMDNIDPYSGLHLAVCE